MNSDRVSRRLGLGNVKVEGLYHKVGDLGVMSDGITMCQLPKIMTDLFPISYLYLGRAVGVKSKLDHLGQPWPVILPVNLTFSET